MEEKKLLKPEPFELTDEDGVVHKYVLSNFDCIEGRRIFTQYPLTGMPKIGDYEENEKLLFRILSHVAVVLPNGNELRLSTPELIRNHIPNFDMESKIEMKMMQKNFAFFRDGRLLDFCDGLAEIFSKKITEMLIRSSEQLSAQEKQPSTN